MRRPDKAMEKKKTKLQTIIYKTLHTKQKIEQRATHKKSRVAKKDNNLNKKSTWLTNSNRHLGESNG